MSKKSSVILITYVQPLADGTKFERLESSNTKEETLEFINYSQDFNIVQIETDKKLFTLNLDNIGKIEVFDA